MPDITKLVNIPCKNGKCHMYFRETEENFKANDEFTCPHCTEVFTMKNKILTPFLGYEDKA